MNHDPLRRTDCFPGAVAPSPTERAVTFKNGAIVLSGSVLFPADKPPFIAVALLHGSGPQTRDWLLPIARRLTEAGAAALVFDKRGTGKSTGSWSSASLEDLTGDAIQAVRALAWLGPEQAEAALKTLKRKLPPSAFGELVAAAPQLPTWLAQSVSKVAHG